MSDAVNPPAERVDDRMRLLVEQTQDLAGGAAPRSERWLAVAGGSGLALGLALIVLGWYGTAQTSLAFEQTPYVVSGGILGLALVVAGAALYVCAWLTSASRHAPPRTKSGWSWRWRCSRNA